MSAIRRFASVEARLVPHRWDWAEANAGRIAANWARRVAAKPAMFNGRVLMLAGLDVDGDRLSARFFETDYTHLTAWLDIGDPREVAMNGFAMGALCGADGPFILGRMAGHTANAGQLYFPAGTPDLGDVTADGAVDLAGSLLREIAEETGIAAEECEVEPRWILVEEEGRVAFMRIVRLQEDAAEACRRIRRFIAADPQAELADVVTVSSAADIDPATMPPYLRRFLAAAFSQTL